MQRIGQTKVGHVVHFVMNKTIELYISNLSYNKKSVSLSILDHTDKLKTNEQEEEEDDDEDEEEDKVKIEDKIAYNLWEYSILQ
jgi:SNF2 family DNA or RNA helicase